MRVPLSWLRDFVAIDLPPEQIAETLDDLGLVVEGVEHVGGGLDNVVVARVTEIAAIEGADKIRRVQVDCGGGTPVQVVCGAWNFSVGDLVPLARVGAVLPGNFAIERRKMRGVVSDGMLCSGRELGLGDDAEGIMLLDSAASPGTPLADALGIEPDVVFDVAVEGNRPDALCMAGVARDLAARLELEFTYPELPGHFSRDPVRVDHSAPTSGRSATIEVRSPHLCDRFGGWVFENVTVAPSPAWMQSRLSLAGMRPINNVVDVSNYVMLEIGQPNHPYDLDRLGGGGLIVRAAEPREQLETLDGVVRVLGVGYDNKPGPEDCVICDANDVPVGIAGIMGGASSEISETTSAVLLEVAHFAPMAIARSSKRLGIRTEASVRFERGCDPGALETAGERFAALLAAISPEAKVPRVTSRVTDSLGPAPERERISLRVDRVNLLMGTTLSIEEMASHLTSLSFDCAVSANEGLLDVAVPTFRPDCSREIDLIEEVARIHGYSRIARTVPSTVRQGGLSAYQKDRRRLKALVAHALGAYEAWTPSFLAPGDHAKAGIEEPAMVIANPVAREESVLRSSMLPGLLHAVAYNASHRNGELRLFEVGHVFHKASGAAPSVPDEHEVIAVLLADRNSTGDEDGSAGALYAWRVIEEALRLDAVDIDQTPIPGLHPTRSARLVHLGEIGVMGEVHPEIVASFGLGGRRIGFLELRLGWQSSQGRSSARGEGILSNVAHRSQIAHEPSRFPSSDLDLAFVVRDGVAAAEVAATIEGASRQSAEWVKLFDVYRGDELPAGTRSLAFRVRLSLSDRTPTEVDFRELRDRMIDAVKKEHGASLRS